MGDDIPKWAWDEVAKIDDRYPSPDSHSVWARYTDELRCALAERIAEHEEPPEDKLATALFNALVNEGWESPTRAMRDNPQMRVELADQVRRCLASRGLKIVESGK